MMKKNVGYLVAVFMGVVMLCGLNGCGSDDQGDDN